MARVVDGDGSEGDEGVGIGAVCDGGDEVVGETSMHEGTTRVKDEDVDFMENEGPHTALDLFWLVCKPA